MASLQSIHQVPFPDPGLGFIVVLLLIVRLLQCLLSLKHIYVLPHGRRKEEESEGGWMEREAGGREEEKAGKEEGGRERKRGKRERGRGGREVFYHRTLDCLPVSLASHEVQISSHGFPARKKCLETL